MLATKPRNLQALPMEDWSRLVSQSLTTNGRIVIVTGAGVSAESGIPTFRGPEGYWTVGSRSYHPQELATLSAFEDMPEEVWAWYLFRRQVCHKAAPNAAHNALVNLERSLGERFCLVTQNVDGLHIRAGNSRERTYQIHGNIDFMRCTQPCTNTLFTVPNIPGTGERAHKISPSQFEQLRCPQCHSPARPHVLWFDECYNEALYYLESSAQAAANACLLITIGTSGAANLPYQLTTIATRAGATLIDLNIEDNPFSAFAAAQPRGTAIRGSAAEHLPELVDTIVNTVS